MAPLVEKTAQNIERKLPREDYQQLFAEKCKNQWGKSRTDFPKEH